MIMRYLEHHGYLQIILRCTIQRHPRSPSSSRTLFLFLLGTEAFPVADVSA